MEACIFVRHVLWVKQRTCFGLLSLLLNQYNAPDPGVRSFWCMYLPDSSECWTKWGVLACYTNHSFRTSTDSGAGEGAEQKIGEPRRWVSMNLGYGARGVAGVVHTILLKRQDKRQTMAQHRGLTHLGSIWELPPIIRILNNSIHFLAKDPTILKTHIIIETCQWTSLGPNGTLVSLSLKFGLIVQGLFEFFKEWLSLTFSPLSPSGSTPFITLKCQSILQDRCYIFAFYNGACPRRDTVSLRKWTPYPVSEGLKPVKETEEAVNPNHILTLSSLSCPLSIPAE